MTSCSRARGSNFYGEGHDPGDITGILEYALEKTIAAEAIETKLVKAEFTGTPDAAVNAGLISSDEAGLLAEATRAIDEVIKVDDFAPEDMSAQHREPGSVLSSGELALAS
jgi:acyl-CoA dehydrogenase